MNSVRAMMHHYIGTFLLFLYLHKTLFGIISGYITEVRVRSGHVKPTFVGTKVDYKSLILEAWGCQLSVDRFTLISEYAGTSSISINTTKWKTKWKSLLLEEEKKIFVWHRLLITLTHFIRWFEGKAPNRYYFFEIKANQWVVTKTDSS